MTDAKALAETAEELVELLAGYGQELAQWERWTPAAAPLRHAVVDAMSEARELMAAAPPSLQNHARAH